MDLGDIFRSFFGLRGRQGERYVPPDDDDWQYDEQESHSNQNEPSGFPFFFGHGSSSLDDMFQHFHKDLHEQMEFLHRQMDDMLNGFGNITSENFPPEHRPGISDNPESHPSQRNGTWFFHTPEHLETEDKKKNPRDFLLKEKDVQKPEKLPALPSPHGDSNRFGFTFKNPFRFPSRIPPSQESKGDTDLDGKISNAEVMDLIKKSDNGTLAERRVQPNRGFFSGQSVSVTTVRGPDGKVEHKKIVKDSSGREESTVSRSVDGQTHSVTTILGPDGQEERHEDFKNMDENDMNNFEDKWKSQRRPQQPPNPSILNPSTRLNPGDMDLFTNFFKDPRK